MDRRFSFHYRTGSNWEYILVGCLAIILVLLGAEEIRRAGTISYGTTVYAFSLMFVAAAAWPGLLDRRPVIVISTNGVWFRYWGAGSDAYLPWSLVAEVNEVPYSGGLPFICLVLKNGAQDITALGFPKVKRNAKWNRLLGCSPFTIRVVFLNVSHKQVLDLAKKFLALANQSLTNHSTGLPSATGEFKR